MMKFFKKKNNSAFTLIETLVAISIFSMSTLGLLVILSKGISDTTYTKKKIIAGYLAQEGIEYMRNMRDTFVLYDLADSQTGWMSFNSYITSSGALCKENNGCYFNADNLFSISPPQQMSKIVLTACDLSCPPLKFDIATGKYGYTTGTDSGFIRKIVITQIGSPINQVDVTSTVSWSQGSGTYSTVFKENLFNWME